MNTCMNEVLAVLQELPGNAQEIWSQAFREALVEGQGDIQSAAAMAWKAFKRKEQRVDLDWDREKTAKGMLVVAAYGGTPEWIKLVENDGLILDDGCVPCLVDRQALEAMVADWEKWDEDLVIYLEDQKVCGKMASVVGWIKEMRCLTNGLWIRVEWTEEGLGYITRKEFGYLSLGLILDESNRPVELWQARLTNYPVLDQRGLSSVHHCGQKGSQAEAVRNFRLIRGKTGLDLIGAEANREKSQQEMAVKRDETHEVGRFLDEMKGLLYLRGDISLGKVKQAIVELKAQQDNCRNLRDEHEMQTRQMLQEVIWKKVEKAVGKGLIKPEQRTWAEVYATRDWQGFNEFLVLAAKTLQVRKRKRWGTFPFFRSLLRGALAKQQETGSKDYDIGCR
jgi:phage I-like protein